MEFTIKWSIKVMAKQWKDVQLFMQQMANRLIQGHHQYGAPRKEQCYMSRMIMEMKAYRRTGNREHLLNIANYCLLETMAPENPKYHFDAAVESVTRRQFGGTR